MVTRVNNQSNWQPAIIKKQIHPRSFVLEDDSGYSYRRNSINIRPTQAKITTFPESVPENNNNNLHDASSTESGPSTSQPVRNEPYTAPVLRRSSRVKTQPQRLQYCQSILEEEG